MEWALNQAGHNRSELEKVLDHYSTDAKDELKLRAALFLIENMPGHESYYGDGIQQYYAETDSIIALPMSIEDKKIAMTALTEKYADITKHERNDITLISADYLIYNIDRAFQDWKEKPWAKTLSFEQFCEFLLPYKVTELSEHGRPSVV